MGSREQAVVKTLLYADIFNAPLTAEELYRYCITPKKIPLTKVVACANTIPEVIKQEGFYTVRGKQKNIPLRKRRQEYSKQKIVDAQKLTGLLQWMPSIVCIGISGSVAAYNAGEHDDIDLCIITTKNTVWVTRLFVLCVLTLLGKRRKRQAADVENKYCVNLMFDTTHLIFPQARRDVFTAHELAALYPLYERNKTYQQLWQKNQWMRPFLAHARPVTVYSYGKESIVVNIGNYILQLVEPIAYLLQYRYMKGHITTEVVSKTFLALHPKDYRSTTLRDLDHKLRLRGLLTNK